MDPDFEDELEEAPDVLGQDVRDAVADDGLGHGEVPEALLADGEKDREHQPRGVVDDLRRNANGQGLCHGTTGEGMCAVTS